jgi:hypothetical protein
MTADVTAVRPWSVLLLHWAYYAKWSGGLIVALHAPYLAAVGLLSTFFFLICLLYSDAGSSLV